MKTKQNFFPNAAMEDWDDFEIVPIKEVEPGLFEIVEEGEGEDYWSVNIHLVRGGVDTIADVETREQAEKLVSLIKNCINHFALTNH
jgi:hypothetical protein